MYVYMYMYVYTYIYIYIYIVIYGYVQMCTYIHIHMDAWPDIPDAGPSILGICSIIVIKPISIIIIYYYE